MRHPIIGKKPTTKLSKADRLQRAKLMYLQSKGGLLDSELAALIDVSRQTVQRYRHALGCRIVSPGRYVYAPSDEEVTLARLVLRAAG